MAFSLETCDLRAVAKKTFVHVDRVEETFVDTGGPQNRGCAELFDRRSSSQDSKFFESEAASTVEDDATEHESEDLSTSADDASENEAPLDTERDATPNLDFDSLRVVIRKTFIHFEPIDEDRSEIRPFRRRVLRRLTDILHARDADAQSYKTAMQESVSYQSDGQMMSLEAPMNYEGSGQHSDAESSFNSSGTWNFWSNGCETSFAISAGSDGHLSCFTTGLLHADAQAYKSIMKESMLYWSHDQVMSPNALVNYEGSPTHSDAEWNVASSDIWNTRSNYCNANASVGSARHFQGLCRPCAWFWRPESCNKGNACEYCHLCDEEAFLQKKVMMKASKKCNRKPNRRRKH